MSRPTARITSCAAFVIFISVVAAIRLDARTEVSIERPEGQPAVALSFRIELGTSRSAASMLAGLSDVLSSRLIGRSTDKADIETAPASPASPAKCRVC
jgi:hypothetical protein